jgi:hypothetical protein
LESFRYRQRLAAPPRIRPRNHLQVRLAALEQIYTCYRGAQKRAVLSFADQNGQAALLGAAAAGSRLRALNAADTSRAMRIAATLILTPSYNNAVAGATTLNVAGGMSGFALGLAPDLALAGFTAQDDAIEEALSSLVGDGFEPAGLLDHSGRYSCILEARSSDVR